MNKFIFFTLVLGFVFQYSIAQNNTASVTIGSGTNQIDLSIQVNSTTNMVDFTMTGPATRWFGIGFAASSMYGAGYGILANVSGNNPAEYNIAGQQAPMIQNTQNLSGHSSSTANGRTTYTFSRSITTGDVNDYTFPTSATTISIIWAYGNGTALSYHANRGISSLSFVNPCNIPVTSLPSQTICANDSLMIFGSYQSMAGTYYDTIQTSMGCDSVVSQQLFVNQAVANQLPDVTICYNDSIMMFGQYFSQSGMYYDTLPSAAGCDSIVSFQLIVSPQIDTMVFNSGGQLLANQFATSYQWYDCATNLPVAGATQQSFSPSSSGTYKVEIGIGNCTAFSSCFSVIIDDIAIAQNVVEVNMYPTPTSDVLNIEMTQGMAKTIKIYSSTSKLLFNAEMNASKLQVNTYEFEAGVYYIFFENENGEIIYRDRFIKL
jgi:hypothetical protein